MVYIALSIFVDKQPITEFDEGTFLFLKLTEAPFCLAIR